MLPLARLPSQLPAPPFEGAPDASHEFEEQVLAPADALYPELQAGQVSAVLLAAFEAVPAAQSVQLRFSDVVKLASVAL